MKKNTVRKLAEELKLSPATISRALNGLPGVSAETRNRILQTAGKDEISPRARKNDRNIALLLPPTHLNYRKFFKCLQTILEIFDNRWNLILLSAEISLSELRLACMRNKLAGIIICGFGCSSPELTEAVTSMPHAWLNSHTSNDNTQQVLVGNDFAGRLAGGYLLDKNCQNCVMLEFPSLNPGVRARYDGFQFEFFTRKNSHATVQISDQPLEKFTMNELDKLFTKAVADGKLNGFDGIFVPECNLVPALHQALRRFRSSEPWPELVCCHNNEELLAGLWPKPTVISLGDELIAELACRELFNQLDGHSPLNDQTTFFISPKISSNE